MIVHGKCFGLAQITGTIEIQYLSFLWRANACSRVEWRVCRVVNGCTQPDGWKVTSADPNGEWFLSGGGSLGSGVV